MSKKSAQSPELRRARFTEGVWNAVRVSLGTSIGIAGFTATIGAIFGVTAAAQYADGGHSGGGLAFMLMGLIMASVIGLLPTILWTFSGSAKNKERVFSALMVGALCLVGCALGHSFAGAFWSSHNLDFFVGGAAVSTEVLTLLTLLILPRAEAAAILAHALWLKEQARVELPPPPPLNPWERTFLV